MKWNSKEVKIAVVAVIGIIVLYFGMQFLKGMKVWGSNNLYYVTFSNVNGLIGSSPIYADGYKVGTVASISFDYQHEKPTCVAMDLDESLRIPKGSTAEIVSDVMGNVQVNLLLANNPRERMTPGDTLQGDVAKGTLEKVAKMLPAVEQLLPKLDSILASVNKILADPAIAQSLHNVQTVTDNLTVSTQELNALMAELNRKVPGMVTKADRVLDNADRLTGNLATVDVQGMVAQVNQTLANVQATTEKLNDTKGSIGLLLNDPALYHNLNATVRDADSLMIDLKGHPKRYVHFSVFGKKDK